MLKKAALWVMAAGIAVSVGQFLVFVAKTYGLPSSVLTPQTLIPMFGVVLVGVGGADIFRYLVMAGIRVKRAEARPSPQLETAIEAASVPDQVLAQQT